MEKLEWDVTLRQINSLLAGLVFFADDYIALARKHKVPVQTLPITKKATTDWFNILDYYVQNAPAAMAQEMIKGILEELLETHPFNEDLKRALEWEAPQVEVPPLDNSDWDAKAAPGQWNYEKLVNGVSSLLPIAFLEQGTEKARSVARIATSKPVGTGFLLKNNYLLTNNHVIPTPEVAAQVKAQFNYEADLTGNLKAIEEFAFDPLPAGHFATSEADDWTIVKLAGDANANWGAIPLLENPVISAEDRVNIIQHPGGQIKQIGMHNNFLKYVDQREIQYLTDTLPGSSGSPVFNMNWELVGLHNRGGYIREPSTRLIVFRNAGIHVNQVLKGIREAGIPGF